MHAATCQGLPCSDRYVILTVAAKCRHCHTKFRINLFGVSRAVSCVQTDSKTKVALRRAATGPNITLLHRQTLPYCPRCGSNTSSCSVPHLSPYRRVVTSHVYWSRRLTSAAACTSQRGTYNRAERCPRLLCLVLTTYIANPLIKHTRIRRYNSSHSSCQH
jgi:hypothetical protein